MTTTTGDSGIVKVGATPDTVIEMKRFSITEEAAPIDDTAKGDAWETNLEGRKRWTAEIAVHHDPTDTAGQESLDIGGSYAMEFYFQGDGSGSQYRSGTGRVISSAIESPEGSSVVERVYQVQGNGALSEATVA